MMKKGVLFLVMSLSLIACTQKVDKKRYFVNAITLDPAWMVKDYGNKIAVIKKGGKAGDAGEVATHEDTVLTTVKIMVNWQKSEYQDVTAKKFWKTVRKEDPADSSKLITTVDSVYQAFIYGDRADSVKGAEERKKILKAQAQ